ncbi:dihydrofolate reductase family protein [Ideonella sp.]|uniref:dihydrofolate reductase family protein n=1 Tax=Ideonella sp. TaxID=1929293 RepID=UPI0035B0721E
MRPLIVSEFVTLDGVMEAPGGEPGHLHTGWAVPFMGEDQVAWKLREAEQAGALLLGRVTYESFAGAWPGRSGAFADRMNALPKHVVSTTLQPPLWAGTRLIRDDIAGQVAALKQADGGPLLVAGSRMLVHSLLAHDLVDEIHLLVFPVAVGSGRRLFPETPVMTRLALRHAEAFANGVMLHQYAVQHGAG